LLLIFGAVKLNGMDTAMRNNVSAEAGNWGAYFVVLLSVVCLAACGGGGTGAKAGPASGSSTTYTITAAAGSHGIITPAGATSVNRGAAQSFTIVPDTGYATATLSVDGAAVSTVAAYTFSNVQANHSISVTFVTAPAGNNIIPSLLPARTSGVAPLSVFFDASGSTDAGISRPFHELEYTWNFGDTNAGTWAYGAKSGSSKNAATGPVAAHVFETPGTYTVFLTIFDATYTKTTSTSITVQDPDAVFAGTNTVCFSTSATYAGCPSGATKVQTSDFAAAINNNQAANRRLLFRRGETFTGTASGTISANGPGIVGAYGTASDPKPNIVGPGTTNIIELARGSAGDWRIMDLALSGQSTINAFNVGVGATGPFDRATLLRLDVSGVHSGIAASHWALSPGDVSFDQWAIQDSTVSGIPGCNWYAHYDCNWRIYIVGTRWSIQGNYLNGQGDVSTLNSTPNYGYSGGSHVFRSEYMANSVLGNNTFTGAGIFQHNIKLHAWAWDGTAGGNATAGVYSEKIVIADNKIIGGINPWLVSIGPQDEISDERVRDVIFERNWITSDTGTQILVETSVAESTFRNNIFDMTGAAYHTGISVSRRGIEPTPNNDRIYNNTFYSGATGDYVGINIGTATNTVIRNNLGSAPLASGPLMITDTGSASAQSNNLLSNTPTALFVSASPAVPLDFRLKAGTNPARDTGLSAVPVLSDFFLLLRPQNAAIDIGAVEGP